MAPSSSHAHLGRLSYMMFIRSTPKGILSALMASYAQHTLLAVFLLSVPFAAQALLDRPQIKCISGPDYSPESGIQFTRRVADNYAYLNVQMIRVEIKGESSGADKPVNYAAYDYIVDQAAARGIAVLGLIDYMSLAHSGSTDWATQSFRDRFAARARELATHYGARANPIHHWEIWNEEDMAVTGYEPRIEPEPYGLLLIAAYDAIKAIDPQATVVLGGISPKGFEYTTNYLSDLYATQPIKDYYTAHGFYPFDVVGVHPYPEIFR